MVASGMTLQLVYEIERRHLGRRRLADAVGGTEMSVRLELERLRDGRLLELRREGPRLTGPGAKRFKPLFDCVRDVRPVELTTLRVDAIALGAVVRGCTPPSAWEARDLAVRGGATGILLLRFESGSWFFTHDGEPVGERNRVDAGTLSAAFSDVESGDHLLVAFGGDLTQAGRGLWHVLSETLHL